MMKIIFLHLALFGSLMVASAQTANNFQQASNYILSRQGVFNQTTMQSGDLYITSSHVSSISGVEHIYLQQTVGGIDVLNGVGSVHLDRSGKVAYGTSEFYNVDQFTIQRSKNLDHKNAIRISAAFLQIEDQGDINMLLDEGSVFEKQVFSNTSISTRDIVTKLVYVPIGQNLVLSIEVFIDNPEDGKMWLLYVNSQTGEIAKTIKLTSECDFGDRSTFQPKKLIVENSLKGSQLNGELNEDYFVSNSYLVYPIPLEAPNEGPQSIVVAPWTLNSAASPYGWHDTNGMSGAEYTITRGNNVYASEDQDNNDIAGFSPDGGANLEFNFPVDTSMLPTTYISGSVTNLFYMNNIMHDVIYNYGFDEVAGNFQANNYGKGGVDNDYVLADALDGSGTDNANFSTPPDGSRPRMQMYRWTTGLIRLTINAPAQVAGTYTVSGADFNPMAATVTGDVVLSDPSNGCTPFSNAAAVNGKIAMIDRGDCAFVAKVDSAIAAGATGVIICNHTAGAGVITMGGMGTKSIPAVMLSYEDCQLLKPLIGSGLNATITIKPLTERDSDLDNG
ncbi:MAG: M36 family metallopeptidase, partial [Saprospiraceae bacterium]|nr:M36 family metallopeptidase [Saprospiraceae bacterium]